MTSSWLITPTRNPHTLSADLRKFPRPPRWLDRPGRRSMEGGRKRVQGLSPYCNFMRIKQISHYTLGSTLRSRGYTGSRASTLPRSDRSSSDCSHLSRLSSGRGRRHRHRLGRLTSDGRGSSRRNRGYGRRARPCDCTARWTISTSCAPGPGSRAPSASPESAFDSAGVHRVVPGRATDAGKTRDNVQSGTGWHEYREPWSGA
jgi:hypothetical protein